MEKSLLSWVLARTIKSSNCQRTIRFIQPTWYIVSNSCTHGHNYFQQFSILTSWIFRLIQSTYIIISNLAYMVTIIFSNFPTSVVKERICESETSELSLLYLHHEIYYNKTSSRWSLINEKLSDFFWESSFISYILWALRRHLPSNWSLTKQFLEYLASSKLVWFHPKVCIVWFIIIILYVFYLPSCSIFLNVFFFLAFLLLV